LSALQLVSTSAFQLASISAFQLLADKLKGYVANLSMIVARGGRVSDNE
jgi:hypothetical protein